MEYDYNTLVAAIGTFTFRNLYSPSVNFAPPLVDWVALAVAHKGFDGAGGQVGNFGFSFGLLNTSSQDLGGGVKNLTFPPPFAFMPDEQYSWRIRPWSINPTADALYASQCWSAWANFTTKPKPPPDNPTIPNWKGNVNFQWAYVVFVEVGGADHYLVEAYTIPDEQATVGGQPFTRSLDLSKLANNSMQIAPTMVTPLVPGEVFGFLDNTDGSLIYRWHVAACAGTTCSDWSEWSVYSHYDP